MKTKIQIRRDTAANWASNNPILSAGEFGLESDTQKIKVGNGLLNWESRPYINVLPSDLAELSQDAVNSALTAGNGITKEYDDLNNTITISVDTSIIANKDYVDNAISEVLDGAPGLLDTLKELAAAIDDDPAFFTSVATNLSNHEADTTSIHGIADTAELATKSFAAELLTNATKSNIIITGDKNGLTITAENGVADSTTSDLVEGTNLYFTDERAQDAVGNNIGNGLSYDDETGSVSVNTSIIQARVADVSDTEIGYLNGVTSSIQEQIDSKLASADLSEAAQDAVDGAIIAGVGLDKVYDDEANTITLDIDSTVATLTDEQTLTNKTLTSPVINGATIGGDLVPSTDATYDLGSSTNKFKDLYLSGTTLYLDQATIELHSGNIQLSHSGSSTTIPIGNGNHTVATLAGEQTLTNKTISFARGVISSVAGYDNIVSFYGQNNIVVLQEGIDKGGKLNISAEGVITIPYPGNGYTTGIATIGGGTRVIITASGNNITGTINQFNDSLIGADFATIDGAESLTNKTLTSPKINEDVVLSASSSELNILDGATLSTIELNYVEGVTESIQDQIDDKAPIDSPEFTGNVELPSTTVFGSDTATSAGKYLRTNGTNVSWEYPVIPYGSNGSPNPVNGQLFFNMDTLSLQIFMDGQWIKLTSYTIDGGDPFTTSFANTFDGGSPSEEPTSTLDGGNVNSFPDAVEGAGADGGEI
jgi:hypothetical protein